MNTLPTPDLSFCNLCNYRGDIVGPDGNLQPCARVVLDKMERLKQLFGQIGEEHFLLVHTERGSGISAEAALSPDIEHNRKVVQRCIDSVNSVGQPLTDQGPWPQPK